MFHINQLLDTIHGDGIQNTLPIIQAHVWPESDEWRAYSQVQSLQNVSGHAMVNHSLHFVDPSTGVHTQSIESDWSCVKHRIKHRVASSSNDVLLRRVYVARVSWENTFTRLRQYHERY